MANNITYILLAKCLKIQVSSVRLCLEDRGVDGGDVCSKLSFLRCFESALMTVQEVEVTRPGENNLGHLWFISAGLCPGL